MDAYDKLSQMKEDLELLNQRIAEEEAEVERLRKELGDGEFMLRCPPPAHKINPIWSIGLEVARL